LIWKKKNRERITSTGITPRIICDDTAETGKNIQGEGESEGKMICGQRPGK